MRRRILERACTMIPHGEIVMTTFTAGYMVGSLAKGSLNRKLARALTRLAPDILQLREIPINELPLYSYDYDADYPPEGRSLKNAIDWASRPWGKNSFARKPSAIIGTSPGKIGTAVAQQHLRSILAFCNSPLMNLIEAYIEFTPNLVTDDGEVTNPSTEKFLADYMKEFHAFIERVYTVLPRTTGGA